MRYHPVWYGLGFTSLPVAVLLLGFFNIYVAYHREIPREFGAASKAPDTRIDWGDDEKEDPPLAYVYDSFRGLRVKTETLKIGSFWDLWNRPVSTVLYKWEFSVTNLTDEKKLISVTYELEGSMGEVIKTSSSSKAANPGETITIEEFDEIPHQDALLVTGSGWLIGRRSID